MSYDLTALNAAARPAPLRPLRPTLAVLIYGEGPRAQLLKHPVHDQDEGYTLGAGAALSTRDRDGLVNYVCGHGLRWSSPHTLATGANAMCWWRPPGVQPLLFEAKYKAVESIARLSGRPVPHPGLVFYAQPGSLSVFAVRGAERPTSETPLMHAPFWNMFNTGQMCQGTVAYPQEITAATQDAWEAVFFSSHFTGASRTDKYMEWGSSYQELLEHALKLGVFPDEVLMPTKRTLAQYLGG
ncbi:hypothetical protein DGo_PB0013 (plasmid) [Deinococcus gobiensis I-0]|uniref:PRTRC system protein B n=1 Tax=Deinococcus gobiensis (strain DSM 21396 / JCM 16679 / CGMCC 1.7299 / I-0) TaxID=745776 RepID=H8H185_DEIGI|nr:hypothetical protein DGo_PB0013 [Deinococcus gobiensis I-0]